MCAIVKASDYVLKANSDKNLITMLTDVAAFVIQSYHDATHSRHVALKKELHSDFVEMALQGGNPMVIFQSIPRKSQKETKLLSV